MSVILLLLEFIVFLKFKKNLITLYLYIVFLKLKNNTIFKVLQIFGIHPNIYLYNIYCYDVYQNNNKGELQKWKAENHICDFVENVCYDKILNTLFNI